MASDNKELFKFCNDPKYREKVIVRIHKDMDKEYNQRIKNIEAQIKALIANRNNEITRISNSRWESYNKNSLMVNRTEGTIRLNNNIYRFSSINGAQVNMIPGYRVVSTETASTKGRKHASIGGAIVGGMIAGPVGAVVGGSALGKTKSKTRGTVVTNQIPTCLHLGVIVTLDGFSNEILLLSQQIDQSNPVFIKAYQEAQSLVALLGSLARTPVPQSFIRPEEEQSVRLLDSQIHNSQRELETARANVPTYTLPSMYRTDEQRAMSDEEYLQYLQEKDVQRMAQAQADAQAVAQAKAQAKAEQKALAQAEAQAKAQAKAEQKALSQAEAQAKVQARAEQKALAQAEAQTKAQAIAEQKAQTEAQRIAQIQFNNQQSAETSLDSQTSISIPTPTGTTASSKARRVGKIIFDICFWIASVIFLFLALIFITSQGGIITGIVYFLTAILINPLIGDVIYYKVIRFPRWIVAIILVVNFFVGVFTFSPPKRATNLSASESSITETT